MKLTKIILENLSVYNALIKAIEDTDTNLGYKDLAKGIALLLKKEYGQHNIPEFIRILQKEVEDFRNLQEDDIKDREEEKNWEWVKKVDIMYVERLGKFYGAYLYPSLHQEFGKPDKKHKISTLQEFNKFLDDIGIGSDLPEKHTRDTENQISNVIDNLKSANIKADNWLIDVS